jgi:hypothetical protein
MVRAQWNPENGWYEIVVQTSEEEMARDHLIALNPSLKTTGLDRCTARKFANRIMDMVAQWFCTATDNVIPID